MYLDFRYRGVLNTVVITYYDGEQFYLPMLELFNILELQSNVDGLEISGKFGFEQISYTIDFTRQLANFNGSDYPLTSSDYYLTDLDFHFTPAFFRSVFGLEFSVDINNLSLNLTTNVELPVVERSLRNNKRRISNQSREVTYFQLRKGRERTILDGGFFDYAFSSNIQPEVQSLSYSGSFGVQVLGGDLQGNIFGNSNTDASVLETDNLRWKTLIRDTPWISSISLGQSPLDGVYGAQYTGLRITNDPVEPRRFFDEFEIKGTTIPLSEVELYLNNGLIDYQLANEIGDYRFLAPLNYGSSQLDLKIYGPTGQLITRTTRVQVPFNFVPKGKLDYRFNAGVLDNPLIGSTIRNRTIQGNISYGLTKWLSARFGVEYYSEEIGKNEPFYTASISSRISKNYIFTIEGVSDAYVRSNLNVIYPNTASFNIDVTEYYGGESIFNSSNNSRQILSSIFYPAKFFKLPLNLRISNFIRVRQNVLTNTQRFDVSTRIKKMSIRLGYSDRLIDTFDPFTSSDTGVIDASATFTVSKNPNIPPLLRGTFLRAQSRYRLSDDKIESGEFLFSKNVFKVGRLQASIGRNFQQNYTSARVNFIIDLKKIRSNSTFSTIRDSYNITQNVRGSIGYDSNFNHFILTSRNQVGKSGAAIQLFIDNDSNGLYNSGDDLLPDAKLRLGRGGAQSFYKNGVLYYTQLLSYYRYNMGINTSTISNPMLVPEYEEFSIITDPNSFKLIQIPFNTSGVMEGIVERQYEDNVTKGIGGLKVLLRKIGENETKELRTFSDGSFYEYPIAPGKYILEIDPAQLELLNSKSEPEAIEFEIKITPSGDFIEGLNFTLLPLKETEESVEDSASILAIERITEQIKASPQILEYSQELFNKIDASLRLIVKAQNAFYSKDMNSAFKFVSESLELFETAQAYALKGSFYYFEGNIEQAQREWEQALRFNPNLYIPNMEVLEQGIDTSEFD